MEAATRVSGIDRPLREEDGILFAIDPADAHNVLDALEYDEQHGVNIEGSHHLATAYLKHAPHGDDLAVLEVGCGSGFLTIGLNGNQRVAQLVAIDISKEFLHRTKRRLHDYPNGRTILLCGDISDTTLFGEATFDAVFGNSLLHHIFDYEAFLAALMHVLKPGGSIAFSEPCQQGKSLAAFFCDAMLRVDGRSVEPVFSEHDRAQINALIHIIKREEAARHDQSMKLAWEDKHCFDTLVLARVAERIGFSKFETFNTMPINDGFRAEVETNLRLMGVTKPLDSFAWLFEAFQEQYVSMCGAYVQTPHQMVVFTK